MSILLFLVGFLEKKKDEIMKIRELISKQRKGKKN